MNENFQLFLVNSALFVKKMTFHFHSYLVIFELSDLLSYNIFPGTATPYLPTLAAPYVVLISKEPGNNLKNVYTIVC